MMLFTPDRQLTWRRRQSGVSIVFSTHAGYCLGAHGFIHAGLRVHEPTRLFDEMVLILAIEAWIFTLWYLERASARGGGGVIFSVNGIRTANSRHRLYTGLISQGMSRVQTLRLP